MASGKRTRAELIDLVEEFRDPSSQGRRPPLARRLEEELPGTDVLNLCQSDLPSDTIVDLCVGFEQTKRILNQKQLLELVHAIISTQFDSEAEQMLMVETFLFNCRHPAGTDLIYYSENVFGKGVEATAEMIVEKALSGK